MNPDSPIAFMLTVMAMRLMLSSFIGYTIDMFYIYGYSCVDLP